VSACNKAPQDSIQTEEEVQKLVGAIQLRPGIWKTEYKYIETLTETESSALNSIKHKTTTAPFPLSDDQSKAFAKTCKTKDELSQELNMNITINITNRECTYDNFRMKGVNLYGKIKCSDSLSAQNALKNNEHGINENSKRTMDIIIGPEILTINTYDVISNSPHSTLTGSSKQTAHYVGKCAI
jgi:Protein of unknown function (DUF3617)